MNTKDIDNKIPIYQLKSKEKVLDYYHNWTKKGEYNKDMVVWNYEAPKNTAFLFNKHAMNKKINIIDAGCGTGLVGKELKKYGFNNLTGVDFSQDMLDLIPTEIYHTVDLIDLNEPLKGTICLCMPAWRSGSSGLLFTALRVHGHGFAQ